MGAEPNEEPHIQLHSDSGLKSVFCCLRFCLQLIISSYRHRSANIIHLNNRNSFIKQQNNSAQKLHLEMKLQNDVYDKQSLPSDCKPRPSLSLTRTLYWRGRRFSWLFSLSVVSVYVYRHQCVIQSQKTHQQHLHKAQWQFSAHANSDTIHFYDLLATLPS